MCHSYLRNPHCAHSRFSAFIWHNSPLSHIPNSITLWSIFPGVPLTITSINQTVPSWLHDILFQKIVTDASHELVLKTTFAQSAKKWKFPVIIVLTCYKLYFFGVLIFKLVKYINQCIFNRLLSLNINLLFIVGKVILCCFSIPSIITTFSGISRCQAPWNI